MDKKQSKNLVYDPVILFTVMLLVGLGLGAVYSSSAHLAAERMGDSFFFLKRQIMFSLLGFALLILAKNIDWDLSKRTVYLLLLFNLCLLVLLFIPGFGHEAGGACRWFRLWGGFSFQPSELTKISLVIYMAYSMSKKTSDLSQLSKGLVPHLIVVGLFMFLIALQPDLGTAVILCCWLLILLFIGGVKIRQLLVVSIIGALALWGMIAISDYRIDRILAFLDPFADPRGYGYHIIHSYYAFGSGGLFGNGIGGSIQKLFFLPEAHTDFILSIIGEEVGLLGVILILLLFTLLIMRGIKVALNAPDLYSTYLALGLITMIGLQVMINMGVVMGLLPTKGLTLPFISYGGSSLVFNFLSIGILLNISSRS